MQPTTMTPSRTVLLAAAAVVLLFADVARADGAGGGRDAEVAEVGRARAGSIKVAAFFSILACGALGCLLPVLGRRAPALRADGDVFFLVKAFAAGVILATGFIHVLPDAFERLASDRLSAAPWREFPSAGFGAMVGAIGALVVDTLATGYFTRAHFDRTVVADDVEKHGAGGAPPPQVDGHEGHVHLHTHAVHGHAHGSKALVAAVGEDDRNTLVRHRVVSQVLELGIVVHSVIIGISLGVSEDPRTIKPLVVALSFHQMFEGMGLGGCIVQAKFKLRSIVTMVLFFCLTTPVAILIGVGVSKVYDESSPTALAVEGLLDAVAAGILVYMALVDLLAEDFTNPKVQSRGRLQLGTSVAMLVGAGLMSMLAKWA